MKKKTTLYLNSFYYEFVKIFFFFFFAEVNAEMFLEIWYIAIFRKAFADKKLTICNIAVIYEVHNNYSAMALQCLK